DAFSMANPSASAAPLARALALTRRAVEQRRDSPDARDALRVKEQQLQEAIVAALGISTTAVAQVKGPVVPGQRFQVRTIVRNLPADGAAPDVRIVAPPEWIIRGTEVTVPPDAPMTRPPFSRTSIQESFYSYSGGAFHLPTGPPPLAVE